MVRPRNVTLPAPALTVMPVPGAFELPLAAMALAKTRRFACIVALGCVIRGDTPHFDYVSSEAASGLQLAAIETGVPAELGLEKVIRPVSGIRSLTKADLKYNGATPAIEVDPETYQVSVDGEDVTNCSLDFDPSFVNPSAGTYAAMFYGLGADGTVELFLKRGVRKAEASAAQLGLAFLGRVPLDIRVRVASDAGAPPAARTPGARSRRRRRGGRGGGRGGRDAPASPPRQRGLARS